MANKRIKSDFSSIFDDNSLSEENEGISTLRITEIEPNKNQPRKNFDKEALEQLAASIRENGVLQPLLVRPLATGNYQLIAGERRWRASKIAGLSEVPVVIRDDLSEEQVIIRIRKLDIVITKDYINYSDFMNVMLKAYEEIHNHTIPNKI